MIKRTVVFPICPTKDQEKVLLETINLYSQAFQCCIDISWSMKKLSSENVHKATYKKLKKKLGLKSQYLCSARNKAVESVKAMRVLSKKGKKVSKPEADIIPIRLDARTLSFDKPRETASVATQHKRIKISLFWHKHAMKYKEWDCKAGEIGINKKGRWVLRLIFEKKPVRRKRTGYIIGVDRGIKHALVSSDNRFLGRGVQSELERRHLLHISKLQSKGTKSAKKRLKKRSGRLRRFKEGCDRVVAKSLFENLCPGDTIVLERLTNIREQCGKKGKARKKHRSKMGRWSFKRVENAIKYDAELNGIYVEYVDPRHTSQTCSRCNIVCKRNRKNQYFYSCSCGLKLNADLNASRNIEKKWRITNGGASGLSVNQPIVVRCH